jgi:hypothetical protein
MLMSGVRPSELGQRWRTLHVQRFISFLPLRSYAKLPTNWAAFGGAKGVRTGVLPHLGIDVAAIRKHSGMTGTFNVADFDSKVCVAIPHDEIDLERMIAGVSLPIFLPAVQSDGRTWTDAVWIKDANLLEAVRRGCTELWLVWCIGNTPVWGNGPLEQYVHMIELSANGALFAELAAIADINDRRANGEEVLGSSEPIVLHVVKPDLPLPLDPDFVAGRISLRARGSFGDGGNRLVASTIVEVADLSEFVADPGRGVGVVGGIETSDWGYRPFVGGSVTVTAVDAGRLVELDATIRVDDENLRFAMSTILPKGGSSRSCWRAIRTWSFTVFAANGGGSGTAHLTGLDALRVLYRFEPSGAHTLSARRRAL